MYYEYNKLRGEINDNPNANNIDINTIEQIGITQEDYAMLCSFMPDPEVISLPIIRQINKSIKEISLSKKIKNLKQLIKYRMPLVLLCLLTFVMTLGVESKLDRFVILSWYIGLLFLLGGVCFEHDLKNRVFLCALFVMIVFYASVPHKLHMQTWMKMTICVCLVGIIGKYGYQCCKVHSSRVAKIRIWEEQFHLFDTLPPNSYIVPLCQLSIESVSPYHVKDFHTKLYPTGWLTLIPLNKGIGYSHRCIVKPNVYFFVSNENKEAGIRKYLMTRYNLHTSLEEVIHNKQYSIIQ